MLSALSLTGFMVHETRNTIPRPPPIPDFRIDAIASPTFVEHASSKSTGTEIAAAGASHTCGPNDNTGICEKYVSSSTETLPIVLGVVIPLVGAFVVFFFLHRRHKKKLRKEDEDDAHKSLDFGLGENYNRVEPKKKGHGKKGKHHAPEMSTTDAMASVRRERGMSMDLTIANPYLLPPGLEQSRESLHSLSRTLNIDDDKYRSNGFIPDDGSRSYPTSLRSFRGDDGSSFTAASTRRYDGNSNQNLLKNARRISGSQSRNQSVSTMDRKPLAPPKNNNLAAPGAGEIRDSYMSTASSVGPNAALRASNNYLAQFISGGAKPENKKPEKEGSSLVREISASEEPPREPERALTKDTDSLRRRSTAHSIPPVTLPKDEPFAAHDASATHQHEITQEGQAPSIDILNSDPLSQDFSLPPIDLNDQNYVTPQHHPEQREQNQYPGHLQSDSHSQANFDDRRETRQPTLPSMDLPHLAEHEQQQQQQHNQAVDEEEDDYYDEEEYYDYSQELGYDPNRLSSMGERPLPPDDPSENPEQRANRIRSFYKEYFDDSSRPNRTPSRPSRQDYYDGSENYYQDNGYDMNQYYDDQYSYPSSRNQSRAPSMQGRLPGPQGRHRATFSGGSYNPGYPRAYSSSSGRFAPPGRRGPPKKHMPPPKPLMVLPTPHMLKDDSFLTHMPIDFAPPGAFKGQRAGTPDSLRGEMKPYVAQRAHTPLASSYDDLAVMPSPHALRKSGTFTALDFAPPPRIKGGSQYGGSDAGSVRSGRSNMSAAHAQSIRAGAYRVSRIPKEFSGTKVELQNELRPKWDMNR